MEAWSQKDDLTEGMYFLLGEEKGKSREPSSLQMVELVESSSLRLDVSQHTPGDN